MGPSLVFRADAGPGIGNGHVMRCIALAQACIAEGMQASFLARIENEAIAELIVKSGCRLSAAPRFESAAEDARATLKLAPGWTVVDGYQFDAPYLDLLAGAQARLAVIDDLAALERYPADMILNQNVEAEPGRYRAKPGCRLLLGPGYALLRPEFAAWSAWRRRTAPVAARALITLGGGETAATGAGILSALAALPNRFEIRLLTSAGHGALDAAAQAARAAGHQVSVLPHASDMPAQMAWADFAIAGGGSTVWELAYMQTPSLLLVLAHNQRANVEGLERLGFALNLGDASRLEGAALAQAVAGLVGDHVRRDEMARIGRELVDGQGAARAARVIRELSA